MKKEQFIAGLVPILRLKVESGDPATYHDAKQRAYQKYWKLKSLEEDPMMMVRCREVLAQPTTTIPTPTISMVTIGPSTQPAVLDNDAIERLNESLTNLFFPPSSRGWA